MKSAVMLLAASLAAIAQAPPAPVAVVNASIVGVVRDNATGAPLKDYVVSTYVNAVWSDGGVTMSPATKQITSTTDEDGRYKLDDLPAAQYHVMAQSAQGGGGGRLSVTRIVTVAGQDLESIDFQFVASGSIRGKVFDENREPVPHMFVFLVSKEYYLGSIGYFLKGSGLTNDQGEYRIANVDAGHPYYLMAAFWCEPAWTVSPETESKPSRRR